MSTLCTYDLSPLVAREVDGKIRLVSTYTASSYDEFGKVLSGPTKHDLPFYNLRLDGSTYGAAPDTLFAEIGADRAREWRFAVNLQSKN